MLRTRMHPPPTHTHTHTHTHIHTHAHTCDHFDTHNATHECAQSPTYACYPSLLLARSCTYSHSPTHPHTLSRVAFACAQTLLLGRESRVHVSTHASCTTLTVPMHVSVGWLGVKVVGKGNSAELFSVTCGSPGGIYTALRSGVGQRV